MPILYKKNKYRTPLRDRRIIVASVARVGFGLKVPLFAMLQWLIINNQEIVGFLDHLQWLLLQVCRILNWCYHSHLQHAHLISLPLSYSSRSALYWIRTVAERSRMRTYTKSELRSWVKRFRRNYSYEGRCGTRGSRKFIECMCIKLKIYKSEKNET